MPDEKIQYSIELIDEISSRLKTVKKNLQSTDKTFDKTGKSAEAFGKKVKGGIPNLVKGAAAIAGIGSAAVITKKSVDFLTSSIFSFSGASAKLRAIVQPTAVEFDKLEKSALKLGSTTAFTASQVMDAYTEQAKLGQKVNDILASGSSVLNLAAMSQISLSQAAQTTVQTLNQFSMDASETNRVVDVMAKSFTSTALDANKFAESMKYAGTIGAESGNSLEDVTASLGALADRAIESSQAGTATRRVMLELADSNSKASKAIASTGQKAETFIEKLKVLKSMNVDLSTTTDLFGVLSSTAATVLIGAADDVQTLSTELQGATGSAEKMADTMLDSLPGASVKMKSALEGLALTARNILTPALTEAMKGITNLASGWTYLLSKKDRAKQDAYNKALLDEGIALKKLKKEYEDIRDMQLVFQKKKSPLFSQDDLTEALNNIETVKESIIDLHGISQGESGSSSSSKKSPGATKVSKTKYVDNSKQIKQQKKLAEEMGRIRDQAFLASQTGRSKELLQLDMWYVEKTKKFAGHKDLLNILNASYEERQNAINETYRQKEERAELELLEKKKSWLNELAEKNKQVLARRAEDDANFRKEMVGAGIDAFGTLENAAFTIGAQRTNYEKSQAIERVNTEKDAEIAQIKNSKKSEKQKQKLIEKAEKEKAALVEGIEREAFEKNKKRSIVQAMMNGALGATKTIATSGFPLAIPMLIAQAAVTATNIAVIASQKFAQGGVVQQEAGKSSTGDQHLVRANPGEEILTREQRSSRGSINIGDTNIVINGAVNEDSIKKIDKTLQDRNESLRNQIIELSEAGRLSGISF